MVEFFLGVVKQLGFFVDSGSVSQLPASDRLSVVPAKLLCFLATDLNTLCSAAGDCEGVKLFSTVVVKDVAPQNLQSSEFCNLDAFGWWSKPDVFGECYAALQ